MDGALLRTPGVTVTAGPSATRCSVLSCNVRSAFAAETVSANAKHPSCNVRRTVTAIDSLSSSAEARLSWINWVGSLAPVVEMVVHASDSMYASLPIA